MVIHKSFGGTQTERLLAELCEKSFLKLWSYPNPFCDDGKELCDLIAVFENDVFIFFDREANRFAEDGQNEALNWKRWKKEAIDKQIATAHGAVKYIKSGRSIFLDAKCSSPFPIPIDRGTAHFHRIVVAHGAKEACRLSSSANVSGSIAITYSEGSNNLNGSFSIDLQRNDVVHVFDGENVEVIFAELDTYFDFRAYLEEKYEAIAVYQFLTYAGEEDLLAHYLINFDKTESKHRIGLKDEEFTGIMIGEGEWNDFAKTEPYRRRQEANKSSYLWDNLIQRTCDNALSGALGGNGDAFSGKSAIYEMAKEPRFNRRALSDAMQKSINSFSANAFRSLSLMPSFHAGTAYVFLQIHLAEKGDYNKEYRPFRQNLLEIACGTAKNKFPQYSKIVGIAIDAPRFTSFNSEDLLVMDCTEWPEERRQHYETENKIVRFFETDNLVETPMHIAEFPPPPATAKVVGKIVKVGRNESCPCGSGKKYKKCCLDR